MSQNKFEAIGPKEWKLKVQAELAGLDYNEVLVTDTAEGIQIKPLYTEEDRNLDLSDTIKTTKDWKIIGEFLHSNKQDHSYLYGFTVSDDVAPFVLKLPKHLDLFFETTHPKKLFSTVDFSEIEHLKYLNLDPISNLAKTGNWWESKDKDFKFLEGVLDSSLFEKHLAVDASLYQNAGANQVQQIAFAVAHAVEYLEYFGPQVAKKLYFKVAIGGNYFFEIAKLRALRKLWDFLLNSYEQKAEIFIFAQTSLRNKSRLDIHNNIIRNSLEAAAAVQGKADAVKVLSFEQVNSSTDFSEELASKQQLLLQKESYFDKLDDAIAGSYFVENLSELLIKNALELFQKIEKEGGFLQALMKGDIQKYIRKSAEKEQQAFDEGEITLIGVNKFRNPNESLPILEKKKDIRKTLIEPIFPKRLAEKIENKQ